MDSLPPEVLRDRFEIHVKDIEQMAATVSQVEAVRGVVHTQAAIEIAQGFVMVRNIATGVAAVLVAMLVVVSLFIIANTIKLATFYPQGGDRHHEDVRCEPTASSAGPLWWRA